MRCLFWGFGRKLTALYWTSFRWFDTPWRTCDVTVMIGIHISGMANGMLSCYYTDVIMDAMASQINSVSIVYSTVCSGQDQRKHKKSASLAFVRRIHRWPVNSPHKVPVTRKMSPFYDVITKISRNLCDTLWYISYIWCHFLHWALDIVNIVLYRYFIAHGKDLSL